MYCHAFRAYRGRWAYETSAGDEVFRLPAQLFVVSPADARSGLWLRVLGFRFSVPGFSVQGQESCVAGDGQVDTARIMDTLSLADA